MTDGAVGATELGTGETELRDLDGVFRAALLRPVPVHLDELEVVEDVAVEIERGSGGAVLERQEGAELPGHGSTVTTGATSEGPTTIRSVSG